MDPYRPLIIDNRPPVAQFIDGNPMTDGLANLFASAINAPIAAGQIRRQRELDDRQAFLQDQQLLRQAQLDQRAETWRGQDLDRQAQRDAMAQVWQEAQIGNMQTDNARQLAAMFGNGVNNAAHRGIEAVKALRGLFAGGRKPGTGTPSSSLWYTFKGDDGATYKINRQTGKIEPAVPAALPTPAAPVEPEETAAAPAATWTNGPGDSFWTMHRSGEPGVGSAGDLLGGLWDGWTGNGVRQGRAGDPSVGVPAADPSRPPEWAAAKIDQGGIDAWHERAKTNPLDFARQLAELKAAGDPRFPIIMAELRRRAGQ